MKRNIAAIQLVDFAPAPVLTGRRAVSGLVTERFGPAGPMTTAESNSCQSHVEMGRPAG